MATISKLLLEKDILLESGTNELEILVFRIAEYTFGINVAKVREVLPAQQIVTLPKAHSSVQGVFKLRERVIPCVSLRRHLNISGGTSDERVVILTDFNHHQTAFEVDHVERIYRQSWESILAVPSIMAFSHCPVTAVARIDNRLVIMLDFEMISDQVTDRFGHIERVDNPHNLPRELLRVLLADDSPTVRASMGDTLRRSGYTNITFFENGALAWNWIEQKLRETGSVEGVADLLISDVEMPQIDGFHLCKRIKTSPQLATLPVLLFSSIVTPDNAKKGQAVGADAQVAKPELDKVVMLADQLIAKSKALKVSPAAAASPAHLHQPALSAAPVAPDSPTIPAAASKPGLTSPAAVTPPGIDPRLWATFRAEMRDRARHLSTLVQSAPARADETLANDLLRTLHTIKSAAMVVPLDEVSSLTHQIEGTLDKQRSAPAAWPWPGLECYTDWLADLADLTGDPTAHLARAGEVAHLFAVPTA